MQANVAGSLDENAVCGPFRIFAAYMHSSPIGVFDSGIGGLTVLAELKKALPYVHFLYVADGGHMPYGDKSMDEILTYSSGITRWLQQQGCATVVVACNTASAAALHPLRKLFGHMPFVGMEPAVKPAAEQTQSGVVGVIATVATFQGELFRSVVNRFAAGVQVLERPCPGLVQQIEEGKSNSPETEAMLRQWLEPMLQQGMDRLVLGCTHYPVLKPLLQKICGPQVQLIDPAPAIARQVQRLYNLTPTTSATAPHQYFTTGNPDQFEAAAKAAGFDIDKPQLLVWTNDTLHA